MLYSSIYLATSAILTNNTDRGFTKHFWEAIKKKHLKDELTSIPYYIFVVLMSNIYLFLKLGLYKDKSYESPAD